MISFRRASRTSTWERQCWKVRGGIRPTLGGLIPRCCPRATLNSDVPCIMRSRVLRPTHSLLACLSQVTSVHWQERRFRSLTSTLTSTTARSSRVRWPVGFVGNTCVASGQHIKEPFQECSSSLLTPSLQHTTVGDIGVLKDMPITHLNLGRCYNLTGEWVKIS